MRSALDALGVALLAPFRRCGLAALLWSARLLPLLFLFALPAFQRVREQSSHNPDAGLLLEPASDRSGATAAWLHSIFDGLEPSPRRWLPVAGAIGWLLVTLLAGGITVRLTGGQDSLRRACARYGWRFLRLGLLTLILIAAIQALVAGPLHAAHARLESREFTQDLLIDHRTLRGTLLLLSIWAVWLLHSCARIDLVVRERRSALRALVGGFGLLLERLPALLLVEACMLVVTGGVALLFWLVCRAGLAARSDSGPVGLAALLLLGALVSWLRTGVELGHYEARCRLLAPVSQNETVGAEQPPGGERGDSDQGGPAESRQ